MSFLVVDLLNSTDLLVPTITSSCCAAKHCSHSPNFILNSSGYPKVSKGSKHVRLSFEEMCMKLCETFRVFQFDEIMQTKSTKHNKNSKQINRENV